MTHGLFFWSVGFLLVFVALQVVAIVRPSDRRDALRRRAYPLAGLLVVLVEYTLYVYGKPARTDLIISLIVLEGYVVVGIAGNAISAIRRRRKHRP